MQAFETKPTPDPTILTTEQLIRAIEGERDLTKSKLAIIDERINGIDTATTLRVEELPHRVDEKVAHAKEIAAVRLEAQESFSVESRAHLREVSDIRFAAAERLATRESELNALALAAAFAAQKEASAKEAEYTRIASSKSESATADAISKLGQLFDTSVQALAGKVDDVRERTGRIENIKVGASESTTERRQSNAALYALIASIIGIGGFAIVVGGLILARMP